MTTIFIVLVILSVPVFYILGLLDFVRTILRKKKTGPTDRQQFLKQVNSEISAYLKTHPKAQASDLLNYFHHQLKNITRIDNYDLNEVEDNGMAKAEVIIPFERIHDYKKENVDTFGQEDSKTNDFWKNWYAENSINLLLYVGAFFIVASASIFVGFQWESIGQQIKAVLLTLLTIIFIGSGFLFFRNPKVKNAGITFSAIGSLLVPLTGVGWYNFVLKSSGISFGTAWLVTSIIGLLIYIGLGLYFKNKFYGYITSLAIWSLSLSFVSLSGLDNKYYILASILANYLILGFYLISKNKPDDIKTIFAEPLQISTSILMPGTLIVGLMMALSENVFFSLEVSISLFLASCYYYLFYSFSQKIWQLATSQGLFPLFLIAVFGWQNAADYRLFYTEYILGLANLGISFVMLRNKLEESAFVSTGIGLTIVILSFFSILGGEYGAAHSLIASCLLGISGILAYYVHQKHELLHISSIAILFFIYFLVHDLIGLGNNQYLLGLLYLGVGVVGYIGAYLTRKVNPQTLVYMIFALICFVLSFLFSISNEYAVLGCFLAYAAIFFSASYLYGKSIFIFGSNVCLSVALFQTISIYEIPIYYQPYLYSCLAVGLYILSWIFRMDDERGNRYKLSALSLILISPLFFGFQSIFIDPYTEQASLITAYIATLLYGFESTRTKDESFRYFSSALAIMTVLWQIKFLEFNNLQMYAIPLGIYFLLLAITRKIKDDKNGEDILNATGIAILILSSMSQAFGGNGSVYALLLGVEGVLFLILGISTNNKLFRISGILAIVLAVISQTYSYLFSLPRWLITGLAGLVFLAVAVFLLLRRGSGDSDHN